MAITITVANQKGGIGKTSTSIAVATGLQRKGYKTLLIDADPQCNSTDTYQAVTEDQETLYDLLRGTSAVEECIQHTEAGDIIAGDPLLEEADSTFTKMGRESILKRAIKEIQDQYDFIVMDNNPSLGVLFAMTITAAEYILIPIIPDRYSLQGIERLKDTIELARDSTNPDLKVLGILITMFQKNTNIAKNLLDVVPIVEEHFGANFFDTKIRFNTAIKNAAESRVPIYQYDANSNGSQDYQSLVEEILQRVGKEG